MWQGQAELGVPTACHRRVAQVGDDDLHHVREDLRRAAPTEVERARREVLDAAIRLDREREILLVGLVDADVVVGVREVDGLHPIALVHHSPQRREAAEPQLRLAW